MTHQNCGGLLYPLLELIGCIRAIIRRVFVASVEILAR
jgi:hypothetical protein